MECALKSGLFRSRSTSQPTNAAACRQEEEEVSDFVTTSCFVGSNNEVNSISIIG
jgi:hypothetical protein